MEPPEGIGVTEKSQASVEEKRVTTAPNSNSGAIAEVLDSKQKVFAEYEKTGHISDASVLSKEELEVMMTTNSVNRYTLGNVASKLKEKLQMITRKPDQGKTLTSILKPSDKAA